MEYYDGTKLLSLKDIRGLPPEIFIVSSNRTGGKTTYFNRLLLNKYLKTGSKFGLLYRYNTEITDVADSFFKDIRGLYFPNHNMDQKKQCDGLYYELFCDGKSCGYALDINSANKIKRKSHLLSDIDRMFFDEFQTEDDNYCTREIIKFQSVHTSIARGQSKHTRYVPVYMASNPCSIINPYYTAFGISDRLREDTRFLRGDGFVMETYFNPDAAKAALESGFNRAFASGNADQYLKFAQQAIYLNDSKAFIGRPEGSCRYICTIKYLNKEYAIKEFPDAGLYYCDDKVDTTFKNKIAVTTDDHAINFIMLSKNNLLIGAMREYFNCGCFRFKNQECKSALMSMIAFR